MKQNVIQGLLPLLGCGNENREILLGLLLTDVLPQMFGPEGTLLYVLLEKGLCHNGLFIYIVSKVDAQNAASSSPLVTEKELPEQR